MGQEKGSKVSVSGRLLWAGCKELWETRARQKRGYKSPVKEFKPCSWERVLGYAKETSEPSMFGVEVPENSR